MINYYYELIDGVKAFGHNIRYIGDFDVKPEGMHTKFHTTAYNHSTRWWLENANGVTMLRRRATDYTSWEEARFDEREFTWIKLQTRDVKTL